jgi:hypothetical protein
VNEYRLFTPAKRTKSLERAEGRWCDDQIAAFKIKPDEIDLRRMARTNGRKVRRQELHHESCAQPCAAYRSEKPNWGDAQG